MKKNRVLVGRRYRLDLKRLRCARCRKKIGLHESFLMGHVVNANNPSQHGHVPICGTCFTQTSGVVSEAIEALRALGASHRTEPDPVTDATTKRPN